VQVFRAVGSAALLGYGAAHAQESIWNGRSWVVTFKHLFDSVVYAAITAGTFGWLWPKIALTVRRRARLPSAACRASIRAWRTPR